MKREMAGAALLFAGVLTALLACALGALALLHDQWIAQMEGIVGMSALAARGYVAGTSALADPTFEDFARAYQLTAVPLCALCSLCVGGSALYAACLKRRAERRLALELDGLLQGSLPDFANSLLDQKKRQVLHALRQRSEDAEAEREKLRGLINDLSHQLKTPIASSQLQLELLADEALSADERGHFARQLGDQLDKISALAGALVKMARLENGMMEMDMRPYDLCETVREALSDIRFKAERMGVILSCEVCGPLIAPHDRTWTKEAVVNLLDNAVKYTHAGGRVTVSAESGPLYARIDVADTGIGIPAEQQQRVFGRFYRGVEAQRMCGEGSGLGLTIARDILRLQGGGITLSSAPGAGTRVSLFLQNR